MIVRTSAKSTLMMPGTVIRSDTPWVACCSTSSASRNESSRLVFAEVTCSRRSFGIVISVSTAFSSRSMPSSANRRRRLPSKRNGLVTTPTVSAPISRATCAMIGAAPVPVPPPMPAVTNTMSAPAQRLGDLRHALERRLAALLRVRPGPEPARDVPPELDHRRRHALLERLHVGVGDVELHALHLVRDHGVDGVSTGSAHPDHLDLRLILHRVVEFKVRHGSTDLFVGSNPQTQPLSEPIVHCKKFVIVDRVGNPVKL
jgi:hypothetical protein